MLIIGHGEYIYTMAIIDAINKSFALWISDCQHTLLGGNMSTSTWSQSPNTFCNQSPYSHLLLLRHILCLRRCIRPWKMSPPWHRYRPQIPKRAINQLDCLSSSNLLLSTMPCKLTRSSNSSFHWFSLCGSISSKEGAACPLSRGKIFSFINCKDIPAVGNFDLWILIKPENARQFFCSYPPECISNQATSKESLHQQIMSIVESNSLFLGIEPYIIQD